MTDDLIEPTELLIMGVGNILWADEGFGVRCAEHFNQRYKMPEASRIIDGGTLGMYLLETVCATQDLLIFDCADLHEAPGSLRVLTDDEVLVWSTTKISAHQTGMNEVLAMAGVLGKSPKRLAVVAVQPAELNDYGGSLTEAVRAQLDAAVEAALKVLSDWGYSFVARGADEPAQPLTFDPLRQGVYEQLRPSEEDAPRMGDMRFVPKL